MQWLWNMEDGRFPSWTELQGIDSLPVGVGWRYFIFNVGHAGGVCKHHEVSLYKNVI